MRTKLRKSSGNRSTGRLHRGSNLGIHDEVKGNRHVGGCCGHDIEKPSKPRPPHSSRSPRHYRKKKKQVVISPSRKFEKANADREEEMDNYRKLVENRFSQMLEDEKSRLRREHNQKKDLLEK